MNNYIVYLSIAVSFFICGYYGSIFMDKEDKANFDEVMSSNGAAKNKQQQVPDLSVKKSDKVKTGNIEKNIVVKKVKAVQGEKNNKAKYGYEKEGQEDFAGGEKEKIAASMRSAGIPEEDIEGMVEGLFGGDVLEESGSQDNDNKLILKEKLAASFRDDGIPEEDIEGMAEAMAEAMAEDNYSPGFDLVERNSTPEEVEEEIAASMRSAGIPEEDIEGMVEGMLGGAVSEESESENQDVDADKKMILKETLVADFRDAGIPEEDIEGMAEAMAEDGRF